MTRVWWEQADCGALYEKGRFVTAGSEQYLDRLEACALGPEGGAVREAIRCAIEQTEYRIGERNESP